MNPPSRRALWASVALLVAAAIVAGVLAVTRLGSGDSPADPRPTALRFLERWRTGDTRGMNRLVVTPNPAVRAAYQQQHDAFGSWPSSVRLVRLTPRGTTARATFETSFRFESGQTWTYRATLAIRRTTADWRVAWRPGTVHPSLTTDTHFSTARIRPTRAPILGSDGVPLTIAGPFVTIGIEPRRLVDRPGTLQTLAANLAPMTADAIAQRLDAPGVQPDYFVEVATIPDAQYQAIKPVIYDLPGVTFRTTARRGAATEQLAAHVVGRVGPITADLLDELGPSYVTGDVVGINGLERRYETRLAGTASHSIDLLDAEGEPVAHLATVDGVAPQAVQTTLDLPTQRAAEATIGATSPAALVAIRPSDGAVRAVVSTPVTDAFDRALDGAYPPGSTFKVVTAAALLANGTTPATAATCPPTITVNGRSFRNFEGESAGALPFSRAFAISCNTAFIGLAQQLPADALATAARTFGFDAAPEIGIAATGGSFPAPKDATERAAAALGQARVTASPLVMAGVAGAVAAGTWRPPSLVTDPAPTRVESRTGASAPALTPAVADPLRALMTDVVRNGTATAAAIAGQPIGGKTGTAEFGTETPPKTHAWFIGFRNDLAFAVVVEGGGVGGRVAAPLARTFLLAAP